MLNRAKDYYENNKEILREQARKKYRNLSEEKKQKDTVFPSYRTVITPFQFSYQIGLLFPLEQIFFGMIFVTERGWNAPILEVIPGVSGSYRSAPNT